MYTKMFGHKKSFALIFALGLFSCTACNAERGGDVRGYSNGIHDDNNNYDHGTNYNNSNNGNYYHGGGDWGAPAVVIGVPGSNAPTCSTVQQCDSDGNCTQSQVCE